MVSQYLPAVLSGVIFLLIILLIPVYIRMLTKGKILTYFVQGDRSLVGKLIRPKEGYVDFQGEKYGIEPEKVLLTSYPKSPLIPQSFQQTVPCLVFRVGEAVPLSLADGAPVALSSKELEAALDPTFFSRLVKASKEGKEEGKFAKMIPMLTMALAGLALVMVFVLMTKMNTLSAQIGALQQLIQLGR